MGMAVIFAAIAVTGTGLMVWFLVAFLLDSAPSTCCWIVPIRREPERENVEALRGSYVDDDYHAECKYGDGDVEVLENEDHAEKHTSGLITIDVRPVSGRVGWRSIQPSRVAAFHNRRL